MKKIIVVFSFIFLQACATVAPIPENYKGPLAIVQDSSKKVSRTKVYFFELRKIDNRDVHTSSHETMVNNMGRGFAMTPTVIERDVPAQKSILSIQGMTHVAAPILALGGGNYSVQGDVEVTLRKNQRYVVKGTLSRDYSAVWVEDAAGRVVSKKIEKKR